MSSDCSVDYLRDFTTGEDINAIRIGIGVVVNLGKR
jgi:hypothetical protein